MAFYLIKNNTFKLKIKQVFDQNIEIFFHGPSNQGDLL